MRRLISGALALLIAHFAASALEAQTLSVEQYTLQAKALLNQPQVTAAFNHIDRTRDEVLREWTELTEINAPSGQEKERALCIEKLLRRSPNLQDIHYDAAGNLIAVRKGTGGGPTVVIDAHMDTVFQPGTQIRATVRDGTIHAPGIGDDTRNIEAMLATMRALDAAQIKTKGDLIFAFTVEEETTFRGVKQFVKDHKGKVNYYIALDGGYEGFTYGGVGINWYRHHFIGPGGHTRSRTPPYSATLPLARAISRIYELKVPTSPSSNLNIGMLGGSDVVNAKAADAWFTVDLRSTSNEVISDLEKRISAILKEEADRVGMTVRTEVISTTPASQIPGFRDSDLVRQTEAVHLALGFANPPITPTASNHSNVALNNGIPAISTGAAPCTGAHALTEACEIEPFYKGIKKILLLEVMLAQLSAK
jgi:acetylornithine deacetylase/succinyl-diaminopimelate desuccinylase-like protein